MRYSIKKHFKKILPIFVFALVVSVLAGGVAWAATFTANIIVQETSGNSYAMMSVNSTMNNDYNAANGYYASANGTDVQISLAGVDKKRMLADNMTFFADAISANMSVLYQMTTNNTLEDFSIIPGYGGYVTYSDNVDLELTDNFTLQFTNLWVDTSTSDNIINKQQAVLVYTDATSGNITAEVFGGTSANYTPDDFADAAGAWTDETLAFDNSVATTAYDGLAGPGWTEYLTIILPSQVQVSGLYLYTLIDGAVDNVTADIWINGAWVTVIPNQHQADSTWTAYHFNRLYNTDRCRVRLYGDAAFARLSEIKFLPGAQVTATETSGEHDLYVGMDSPFFGMGLDPSTFQLCVTDNLVLNAPLWQQESDNATFTTIDSTQHTGTVTNGAVWSSDGYAFDGVNQYITFPNNSSSNITNNQITLEAWVNIDVGMGDDKGIISKYPGAGSVGYWLSIGDYGSDPAGGHENRVFLYVSGSTAMLSAPTNIKDGNWHHVVATYNAGNSAIYIDGVVDNTDTGNNINLVGTPQDVEIGKLIAGYFDGTIGEARIYNIALTGPQVLRNYNATSSKYTTGDIYQYSTLLSVYDNANDYVLLGTSSIYTDNYSHTVGGTREVYYAPNDIIQGTTLPDLDGGDHPGTFTWGTMPAGIEVTAYSMYETDAVATTGASVSTPDAMGIIGETEGIHKDTLNAPAHEFAPVVDDVATFSDIPAVMLWHFIVIALALVAMGIMRKYVNSVFASGLVGCAVLALFVQLGTTVGADMTQGPVEWWQVGAVAFATFCAATMERMPSV